MQVFSSDEAAKAVQERVNSAIIVGLHNNGIYTASEKAVDDRVWLTFQFDSSEDIGHFVFDLNAVKVGEITQLVGEQGCKVLV